MEDEGFEKLKPNKSPPFKIYFVSYILSWRLTNQCNGIQGEKKKKEKVKQIKDCWTVKKEHGETGRKTKKNVNTRKSGWMDWRNQARKLRLSRYVDRFIKLKWRDQKEKMLLRLVEWGPRENTETLKRCIVVPLVN